MAKEYQLNRNCGLHTCADGSTVRPGEKFESDADLCKMFPGKFTCLSERETLPEVNQAEAEKRRKKERAAAAKKKRAQEASRKARLKSETSPTDDPPSEEEENEEETDDRGEDVTEEFDVGESGYSVFKDNRKYVIYDDEGDAVTEPSTKKATKEFLAEEENEEEENEEEENGE